VGWLYLDHANNESEAQSETDRSAKSEKGASPAIAEQVFMTASLALFANLLDLLELGDSKIPLRAQTLDGADNAKSRSHPGAIQFCVPEKERGQPQTETSDCRDRR
jgi:hypothetical protein